MVNSKNASIKILGVITLVLMGGFTILAAFFHHTPQTQVIATPPTRFTNDAATKDTPVETLKTLTESPKWNTKTSDWLPKMMH
jgi:hypothetical protein